MRIVLRDSVFGVCPKCQEEVYIEVQDNSLLTKITCLKCGYSEYRVDYVSFFNKWQVRHPQMRYWED